MSKIDRTGAGGSGPISSPEPPESSKEISTTKESEAAKTSSPASDTPPNIPKSVPDQNVVADLKVAGNMVKAKLQSELQNKANTPENRKQLESKKEIDADKEKEMALELAQNMPRFAPPYVPVGPVVMGDNIAAPGHTIANGEINELKLTADQFQINDQGNLVITNPKLIEFFKQLKNNMEGPDIRLGITKMKPPGEE